MQMEWKCFVCKDSEIDKDCEFFSDCMSRTMSFHMEGCNRNTYRYCNMHDCHLRCFHDWVTGRRSRSVSCFLDSSAYVKAYDHCNWCGEEFDRCVIRTSVTTRRDMEKLEKRQAISPRSYRKFDMWRDYLGLNASLKMFHMRIRAYRDLSLPIRTP